jgi:hypothetical protein
MKALPMMHLIRIILAALLIVSPQIMFPSAYADDWNNPLADTTCSAEQILSALVVLRPNLKTKLSEDSPFRTKVINELRAFLALSPEERHKQSKIDPDAGINSENSGWQVPSTDELVQGIADTCDRY